MVSIINILNGIKEPTYRYQNCNTTQILIFGEYVEVRESLYIQVVIWFNTILNHIVTRAVVPRYQGFCMVYVPAWY